jgi:hypothetical protein
MNPVIQRFIDRRRNINNAILCEFCQKFTHNLDHNIHMLSVKESIINLLSDIYL